MSIVTSREELERAKARVAAMSDDVLARNLVEWIVSANRSADDYDALAARLHQLRDLHAEEETWVGLIGSEIRRRRDAVRGAT